MSSKTLSRQAIRLAQRQSLKAGRPLTRDEILRLQVQTVEPWKRILIAGFGLVGGIFAFFLYKNDAPGWIWTAVGLASAIVLLCGFFGRKSYLDRELRKLKDDGPTRILDAIINGLS